MQELLDNALVLATLVALGGIATVLGPRLVFLIAPPFLVLLVVLLIRLSFSITAIGQLGTSHLRVISNPAPWRHSRTPPTGEQDS